MKEKRNLNKCAIFFGVITTLFISVILLLCLKYTEWTDSNFWTLYTIIILVGLCAYFIGGIVAGSISKYRGSKHGFYVGINAGIIAIIVNTIANLVLYGIFSPTIWLTPIGIAFVGCISALGGLIGCRLSRRMTVNSKLPCSLCGSEVTLRTVINGKDVGKRFYVCNNYPECKGRIKA